MQDAHKESEIVMQGAITPDKIDIKGARLDNYNRELTLRVR